MIPLVSAPLLWDTTACLAGGAWQLQCYSCEERLLVTVFAF